MAQRRVFTERDGVSSDCSRREKQTFFSACARREGTQLLPAGAKLYESMKIVDVEPFLPLSTALRDRRRLSPAPFAMGLLDSYYSRRAAAGARLMLNFSNSTAANTAAAASRATARTSAAAVATSALMATAGGVPSAGRAVATIAAAAAAPILLCASKAPASAVPSAARQGIPVSRTEGFAAHTEAPRVADRWAARSKAAVFSSSFVCRWSSSTMPSIARNCLFSTTSGAAVTYSLRPWLAAGFCLSAVPGAVLAKACRQSRIPDAAAGSAASWTTADTATAAAAAPSVTSKLTVLKRYLMTPSAAAAARAHRWSLSAVAAAKTEEDMVLSLSFCAGLSTKEAIGGSTMQSSLSGKTGQPAAGNESLTGSRYGLSFSPKTAAASTERQRSNTVFPFEGGRLESAANSQVMLPGCTAGQWSTEIRYPEKAEVASRLLCFPACDSRDVHHSERVSVTGEGTCSLNSSRSRYSNKGCSDSSGDIMKWSCSNSSVGIVEKEQDIDRHSTSNAARRCCGVSVGTHSKTLCSPTEWVNSLAAQKRILAGEERDVCSTTNSRDSRQKTDTADAHRSSGINGGSSGSRSYSTTNIWKDETNREKRKNDTAVHSTQTEFHDNLLANSASCVFKGSSSLSPCPQRSALHRLADAFPNGAVSGVFSATPVDPRFDVAFAAVPDLFPGRGGYASSTVGVLPPAAVVTSGTTAVSSAGTDYPSLPSSWMLLVLIPLAAFLAAAFEAQHRQRVAACEANSSGASSTASATKNSSSSSSSVPSSSPSAFSIFGAWLPSRLLRVEGTAGVQADAAIQQQLPEQKVELQQQQEKLQHHPKQRLQSSCSEELHSSLPGSSLFFSSAAVAGQSSSPGTAENNAEGVGDSGLRWTHGAVASYAEAANAPLEDRSLAVVLPLSISSEALFPCSSSSSRVPSQTGRAGELEAVEELLSKAALVFPEEIRRRQQKDESWRLLRLSSSPTPEAASLSLSGLCPRLAVGGSEYGGSDALKKEGDARKEKDTGLLQGDSSNICLLAAVIDGHGGPQVAEYVQQNLPRHVHRELRRAILESEELPFSGSRSEAHLTDNALENAMTQAFRALDDEIFSSVRAAYALSLTRGIRVGACCTAILLLGDRLLVANSGDCKAILSRDGGKEVIELNVQLNANSPEERQRLRKEHPGEDNVVICKHSWEEQRKPSSPMEMPLYYAGLLGKTTQYSACYVKGRLQPTRAFGDFLLKKPEYAHELRQRSSRRTGSSKSNAEQQSQLTYPYLTVDPVVSIRKLCGDEDFVVLGSDGVWDFLSDADVNCTVHASLRRTKEQGILSQTARQTASVEPSPSTEAKRNTPVDASEAARTAAADIVRTVLGKAADAQNMTTDEMKACDPKRRRHYYDDTTAVVVLLGNDVKTGELAAVRSKL